jgi:hypothetical protein
LVGHPFALFAHLAVALIEFRRPVGARVGADHAGDGRTLDFGDTAAAVFDATNRSTGSASGTFPRDRCYQVFS